jgi:hypothetical protein
MVDKLEHDEICLAHDPFDPPSLHVIYIPSRAAQTVRVVIYEACQWCPATVVYCDGREPLRRFHRSWRARLAVWLATWEHRNDLWGSAQRSS